MPDLERQSSIAWLHAVEPEVSSRLGVPVRPIEDLPEIRPLLVALGRALDQPDAHIPGGLAIGLATGDTVEILREVLAQLGPARLLRVLAWLDTAPLAQGEEVLNALVQDNHSEAGRAIQGILHALHRQALLARIFHPDRLAMLQAATASQKGSN